MSALLLSAVLLAVPGAGGLGEAKQVKAMWVARWSITSPERVTRIIELAKKHGYNALIVQVRGRGDAFYKSRFEPRAEDLADQPPDFDPLQMLVDEGHKAGIQVHAWLNAYFTWGSSRKPVSPDHIVNKHPDWLMRTRDGEVTMTAAGQTEGAYTCPSDPEARKHIAACFLDVAEHYAVDGIHFDFVRYPSRDYCYCDGCLARFKDCLSKRVPAEELAAISGLEDRAALTVVYWREWDEWRRQQVTSLVAAVYKRAKALKPKLVVSAAVFANSDDAYSHRFQDWKRWLAEGRLDLLCPMAYSTDTDTVVSQVSDAVSNSNGRPVWAGIGAWRISPESTAEKISRVTPLGVKGTILFSYGGVTNEGASEEFLDKLDRTLAAP